MSLSRYLLLSLIGSLVACADAAPALSEEHFDAPDVAPAVDHADPTAPPDVPSVDPCDFAPRTDFHLRPVARWESIGPTLAAGTHLELLAVRDEQRGAGVLTRVRVRGTATTGYTFLDAAEVVRCQRSRPPRAAGVREERVVVVDGVEETWRLRFQAMPTRVCANDDRALCSCYGRMMDEMGDAMLERLHDGVVFDRIGLGDLVIPRRIDPPHEVESPTEAQLARLPELTVLDLGDYDHDGRETEFPLESGYVACGHPTTMLVGLSRDRPQLHELADLAAPDETMAVDAGWQSWERIRQSPVGQETIYRCGDHGGDTEEAVRWSTEPGVGLRMRAISYDCDTHDRRVGPAQYGDRAAE